MAYISDVALQQILDTRTGLGYLVTKVETVASVTQADLFTVTGKVLITLLTGEVTAGVATGPSDYVLSVKTTSEAICGSTSIVSDPAGTMYLVTGQPEALLNGGGTPTTRVAGPTALNDGGTTDYVPAHSPFVLGLAGGSLIIQSTHTTTVGGEITWSLFYIPLEAGATVVAA